MKQEIAEHESQRTTEARVSRAADERVLAAAAADDRTLISADTDFGELLARTYAERPSVVLLRRQTGRIAGDIAELLTANLDAVSDDLDAGALVVFDDTRIRVRRLPIGDLGTSGRAEAPTP